MKKLLLGISVALVLTSVVIAAASFGSGDSLPATCVVGDRFTKSSTPVGQYECTATNVWTAIGFGVNCTGSQYIKGDGSCGSGGSGATWGDITGTLSNQADLQAVLDGKEPAGVAFSDLSGTASDAQIPITSPVARTSEAKYKIRSFNAVTVGTNTVQVDISVQDASGNEIRVFGATVPDSAHPTATFGGMATAMITVRASETGTDARKLAFRILGYLADNGYFPAATLTP